MQKAISPLRIKIGDRLFARYGTAVATTAVAFGVRLSIATWVGPSDVPFITYSPAVMLTAVYGGLGPGLLATALSALAAAWIIPPEGSIAVTRTGDILGLVLFSILGAFMSIVAEMYHRARKRAADSERALALQKIQMDYRELVQNANSAIIRWKSDGTITFFNEYAQKFFGYSQEEIIGKSASILVPETESTGADLTTLLDDILARPEKYESTVNENILKDGTRVWMSWTNKATLGTDGHVAEVLAIGSDITARQRAEEALQTALENLEAANEELVASNEEINSANEELAVANEELQHEMEARRQIDARYRHLFDSMTEGFGVHEMICDAAGQPFDYRFLELNPAFEEQTGAKVADLVGKTFREVFPGGEPMWIEAYGKVALTGEPAHFEAWFAPLERWFDVRAYQSEPNRFAVVFFDITERKHAEEALQTALEDLEAANEELVASNEEINATNEELQTEIEQRTRAEEELRGADDRQREFYRRTILAATEGKLAIAEQGEIAALKCTDIHSWEVGDLAELGAMRDEVRVLAQQAGMSERRSMDFLGCVVEAATNAIKHAGGGKARMCTCEDSLLFFVSDEGPGIAALSLPDVALVKGYSTAGTLGMGYTVMLRFADTVYLATGPEGTTVAIQMGLEETDHPTFAEFRHLSGWTK